MTVGEALVQCIVDILRNHPDMMERLVAKARQNEENALEPSPDALEGV